MASQTTEEEHIAESPSTEWADSRMEEGKSHVPDELRDQELFIAYKIESDGGKPKKVPKRPTPKGCYNTDPTSTNDAVTYEEAMDAVELSNKGHKDERSLDGVGLVIPADSDLVGVDIDDAFDASDGSVMQFALEIVYALPSYVEVSPSGTGLHIICYAPDGLLDGAKNKTEIGEEGEAGLEIYDGNHYFTFTGRSLKGCAKSVKNVGPAVREIQRAWMGSNASSDSNSETASRTHRGETEPLQYNPQPYEGDSYEMTEEDWELVETACDKSERFEALFDGTAEYTNRSDAEFDFFCKLAHYTQHYYGKYNESEIDAMERIARASELSRDKFDRPIRSNGEMTYLRYSLAKAIRENGKRRRD